MVRLALGALTAFLLLPASARADALLVTSGVYSTDFEGHLFQVSGPGFSLFQRELGFFPVWETSVCRNCSPGDLVDLSSRFTGQPYFGSGSGTIGGVTYSSLTYEGWFDFRAPPVVFPETLENGQSLTSAFLFTGFLRAFANGNEVFAHDLRGSGRAGAFYFRSNYSYWLEESQPGYRFFAAAAPVPEPATLLLVGGGALALAGRRLRSPFRDR